MTTSDQYAALEQGFRRLAIVLGNLERLNVERADLYQKRMQLEERRSRRTRRLLTLSFAGLILGLIQFIVTVPRMGTAGMTSKMLLIYAMQVVVWAGMVTMLTFSNRRLECTPVGARVEALLHPQLAEIDQQALPWQAELDRDFRGWLPGPFLTEAVATTCGQIVQQRRASSVDEALRCYQADMYAGLTESQAR